MVSGYYSENYVLRRLQNYEKAFRDDDLIVIDDVPLRYKNLEFL